MGGNIQNTSRLETLWYGEYDVCVHSVRYSNLMYMCSTYSVYMYCFYVILDCATLFSSTNVCMWLVCIIVYFGRA